MICPPSTDAAGGQPLAVLRNRPGEKMPMSTGCLPSARSASRSPSVEDILKPCPEQPAAMTRCMSGAYSGASGLARRITRLRPCDEPNGEAA